MAPDYNLDFTVRITNEGESNLTRLISELDQAGIETSEFKQESALLAQRLAEITRQQALIDLYAKLAVSEAEIAEGAEGEDFLSVARELRGLVHGRL